MVVQHNLTAMNSNRMLGVTTKSQAKSTEKLSSGYKINRAADDAAGLAISEKMRKQIRGLTQASANAQDGISAVQTAEGALTEVHDMLQRMNELAVKAANGTNSVSDRDAIQAEIDQLVTEIDRVAETTKFNETYLLKGNKQAGNENTVEYKSAAITATFTGKNGKTATSFYKEDGTAHTDASIKEALAAGDKIYTSITCDVTTSSPALTATLKTDATAQGNYPATDTTYTYDATQTKWLDSTGADATATVTSLVTISGTTSEGMTITISGKYGYSEADAGKDYTYIPAGAPTLFDADGNALSENALDEYFSIDASGNISIKSGKGIYKDADGAVALASGDIANYVQKNNTKTASLNLNLHVGADATTNNQINLEIEAMSAKVLGVDGLKVNGRTADNALEAIETIKAAITKVSSQRSDLGAVQNRLEHTIANLDNVVENTTAAESQIRDTDMATEMVKYSNNNILAQAGTSMLAQANQANQNVLSLLG